MKRSLRLGAALAALALLSGCSSLLHPRQVEDLQLIQTIGFDGGVGDVTVSVSSGEASEDAVSAQLAARGACWAPYRTYASLYLWRIADAAAARPMPRSQG